MLRDHAPRGVLQVAITELLSFFFSFPVYIGVKFCTGMFGADVFVCSVRILVFLAH